MESFNNIKMANPLNLWKNGEAKNIQILCNSISEQSEFIISAII